MLDREEKYRINNYKLFRGDTEDGDYDNNDISRSLSEKSMRDFRQDVFELHLASMFIDYVNYRISYNIFFSRVFRIWKNRDYEYSFSYSKGDKVKVDKAKLRDIMAETTKVEIPDMNEYRKFLNEVRVVENETQLRNTILRLVPLWRRLLIKLNLGK